MRFTLSPLFYHEKRIEGSQSFLFSSYCIAKLYHSRGKEDSFHLLRKKTDRF
ncbi:hypothetical protein HMPREF1863_00066 [Aedoeadaptatus coxii]|uniref:Uncharacterized protein n=1 Tax=Aedoeadaptatus coxii TaxID=755172 RepID=A0A134AKY8_9FIRM|nr:hypothetical protein HMPREF1863_00066 [Peptoniphilus coxii]